VLHDLVLLDGEGVEVDILNGANFVGLYETAELGDGDPRLFITDITSTTASTTTTTITTTTTVTLTGGAIGGCIAVTTTTTAATTATATTATTAAKPGFKATVGCWSACCCVLRLC
jgi:hypothetical protein